MARSATHRLTPDVIAQVRRYRQRLRAARIPITKLLVFGSRAKGTARDDSDIDVAVVSPRFGRDYFREGVRLSRLRWRDQLFMIEPHPFHPDDLNDRWSTLAHEVRTHGIPVDEESRALKPR